MIFSIRLRKQIFLLLETAFFTAALYHGVGMFYEVDHSTVSRHAVFTGLDLFCIYGFRARHNYFVPFFAAFTLHQYSTHGNRLIDVWINQGTVHWISAFVLILLPLGLICLIADRLQSFYDDILSNFNFL